MSSESESKCDNSFESVLWRKLACDFRLHAGWRLEDMEKRFREVVRETMRDHRLVPEDSSRMIEECKRFWRGDRNEP